MTSKRLILVISVAAVALVGWRLATGKGEDFDAQYIILPSGAQAYCNRQGYREIRLTYGVTLVTDRSGDFVGCDAKVGPPWDQDRTDGSGELMSPAGMNQARTERIEREFNSPAAVRQRREAENAQQKESHSADVEFSKLTCANAAEKERAWRDGLSDDAPIDWTQRRAAFKAACEAEGDERSAVAVKDRQALLATEEALVREKNACRVPYELANKTYMAAMNAENGRVVSAATTRMNNCISEVEQRSVRAGDRGSD